MTLLVDSEYSNRIRALSKESSRNIVIFSAYIKEGALDWLANVIGKDVDVRLIGRWQKNDILTGASDLMVYNMCKKNGWHFGICSRLHGKLFVFDSTHILLGSANITNRGLSLDSLGNLEFGVEISVTDVDLSRISCLQNEVTWVNDELFEQIKSEVESTSASETPAASRNWSSSVRILLEKPVEYLWVRELSFVVPGMLLNLDLNDVSSAHDFQLLGLDLDELSEETLKRKFKQSRLYHWFCAQLKKNKEMSFGAISKALHNSLLDDPRPYRKEVKELVAVLYSWAEFLSDDFEITKHKVTSSVRLYGT